jgi:hypothetical protein
MARQVFSAQRHSERSADSLGHPRVIEEYQRVAGVE